MLRIKFFVCIFLIMFSVFLDYVSKMRQKSRKTKQFLTNTDRLNLNEHSDLSRFVFGFEWIADIDFDEMGRNGTSNAPWKAIIDARCPIVCLNEHQVILTMLRNTVNDAYSLFTIHKRIQMHSSMVFGFIWFGDSAGCLFFTLCLSVFCRIGLPLFCGAFDHTNIVS